ncbi:MULTISPECIES: FAD-dependent monooxygenase [Nocardia]|uniref:FAD-dependent monooxygenase n=1 Tax=Nocardia TaxID=1817 RepID=UPI0007EB341D|nr:MULTISPECIES: FAD-dependent monooxygenase [Nocardia]MBF6277160.1 FAD-dependent monooxygenase [Nocardia nova]OBA54769.1 FAD-dependent oxidoreductase [Nocardia sp. 852002-51101_SCH5132738]OBB52003.1 FAD-dependent oxidoreductase [Nocardia sp. 852002-51244_SCH5132740]OBF72494.1 FAD-dependent oxidoreductase [Mycobacterium sp. 852002-51759_SCH5129042]
MRNTTVLISGASIAGPALAYWLQRYGFAVTVVERAPELRPGGQAVDFKGATHRTVLERMGVWEEIHCRQTGKTDMVLTDAEGRELAVMSGDFTGGDVEILRGDLAEIFYERTADRCEYLFGDSVAALRETATGVEVEFENASARTFDLVVGCDGIHSRVRALAFGPEADYVKHLGYYYCTAGAAGWGHDPNGPRQRNRSLAYSEPGRLAVRGGNKAAHMYMFAADRLSYDRRDEAAQRRVLAEAFAGAGGPVPAMMAELSGLDSFYLDSIGQVRMKGRYTTGRIALVGDSAYGNTLGGFGTGLAVVGAYVLAGELALAGGDHTAAFARYDELMKRYAKIAGNSNAGRFLAPRTARGIRMRNWFLGSRMFDLMLKYTDNAANDIELRDYPALVAA